MVHRNYAISILVVLLGLIFVNAGSISAKGQEPEPAVDYSDSGSITLYQGEWRHVYATFEADDYVEYYLETDTSTEGLSFFYCDQANYDLFASASSASVYDSQTYMHIHGNSITIPYGGVWHFVFYCEDYSVVNFDYLVNIGESAMPVYSDTEYDYTNTVWMDNGVFAWFEMELSEGDDLQAGFTCYFETDYLTFYIMDEQNYIEFDDGYSFEYLYMSEYYTQDTSDVITVDADGYYYAVFINDLDSDTVTYAMFFDLVEPDSDDSADDDSESFLDSLPGFPLGILAIAAAASIMALINKKRK